MMLGLILNVAKLETVPSETFLLVGYSYNLHSTFVFVPPERAINMSGLVKDGIHSQSITARTLMSLLGTLAAMKKLVHLAHLHLHPIQWHLKDHWTNTKNLEHTIPVTTALHQAFRWWLGRDNLSQPCSLQPKTSQVKVYPDASLQGSAPITDYGIFISATTRGYGLKYTDKNKNNQ